MANAQRTWMGRGLNSLASRHAANQGQLDGQSLPCVVVSIAGAMVTVAFQINSGFTLPEVQMPIMGSEYVRLPIQSGCRGFAVPASARLGGVSGLGGPADLSAPSNLGALVFLPVGNLDFSDVDPNAVTVYGPNGVVLRDTGSETVLTLTPSGLLVVSQGTISLQTSGASVTISGTEVNIAGTLIINGQPYLLHEHLASGGTGIGGPVAP